MAKQTLEELLVLIEASTAGLREELNRGASDTKKFESKVEQSVNKLDSRFSKLGSSLRGALAAFGVGVSVVGLVRFTQNAINAADAIGDAAKVADFGVERFQRLRSVFEDNGVTASEFDMGMQRLNRRLGLFVQTGGGPAAKAIRDLGIEQDITSGKVRTAEQLFDVLVEKLEGIQGQARAAAIASAFFGDEAGPKLVQTLRLGTAAMAEAEAAATGIIGAEQISKADAVNDAYRRIASTVGGTLKSAFIDAAAAAGRLFDVEGLGVGEVGSLEMRIAEVQQRIEAIRRSSGASPIARTAMAGDLERYLAQERELQAELLEQSAAEFLGRVEAARGRLESSRSSSLGPIRLPHRQLLKPRDLLPMGVQAPGATQAFEQLAAQARERAEQRQRLESELRQLEEQTLRAQGRMSEAIRAAADEQIRQWQIVAQRTPEFAGEASQAIELINQRTAAEIKNLKDKAGDEIKDLGEMVGAGLRSSLANYFRGINQDFGDLLRNMAAEFAASGLIKAIGTALTAGAGGGAGSFLAGLFGGGRASGGPVNRGTAYMVGERGPELFVPDISGRVLSTAQTRAAVAAAGAPIHVEQHLHFDVGLETFDQRIAGAAPAVGSAAVSAVMKAISRRKMA